jgi:hypothetical protein
LALQATATEDHVNHKSPLFGEELRRKRVTAGLSLAQLAQMVHYSKAQLSKVERGIKAPGRDLARLCDAALDANGELASLASTGPTSRRQVLTAGALAVPAVYLGGAATPGSSEHADLAGIFRSQFDRYRKLGQTTDPGVLIPLLAGQTNVILEIARNAGERTSRALLIIASCMGGTSPGPPGLRSGPVPAPLSGPGCHPIAISVR